MTDNDAPGWGAIEEVFNPPTTRQNSHPAETYDLPAAPELDIAVRQSKIRGPAGNIVRTIG